MTNTEHTGGVKTIEDLDDVLDWHGKAVFEVFIADAAYGQKIVVDEKLINKHRDAAKARLESIMQDYAIDARIAAHAEYKKTLVSAIETYPTNNDWGKGRKQGIQD